MQTRNKRLSIIYLCGDLSHLQYLIMEKPKIRIPIKESLRRKILPDDSLDSLKSFADVTVNPEDRDLDDAEAVRFLRGADGVMGSWGVTALSPTILDAAPDLKIWCHAAGSLKSRDLICDEAWEKDIVVTSAAPAIADDVAEFTIAMIGIALRKVLPLSRRMAEGNYRVSKSEVRSLYRSTVGIIGASQVGIRVMRLLRPYEVRILLFDPFVSEDQAHEAFGAELVDLETMARECEVISCHAPKLDATRHMWHATHFRLMRDDAVFINNSRGANIDEEALITELRTGRISACIDVTDPEPCALDSPLRTLPNVILTPHIAGAQSIRVGTMATEELRRFFAGEDQIFQVTKDMLFRMG
jgi:phosphoglycerate dehydrogenase-like enzyme